MLSKQVPLGIYEKALPGGECWLERLRLAKELGFDFVEISVDETDDRWRVLTGAASSDWRWWPLSPRQGYAYRPCA